MTASSSSGGIDVNVGGDVRGQIAVGSNIAQYSVGDRSMLVVSATGEIPRPRPRPRPVQLHGRAPRHLFGRDADLEVFGSRLGTGTAVALYGDAGVGKTSVLKALAHGRATRMADGVISIDVHDQPLEDLLQYVFDVFYECEMPLKPTVGQLRSYLRDIDALIVLDDVAVDRETLRELLDFMPNATFLCASERRMVVDDGNALPLRGLGDDAALSLLREHLGRPLTDTERSSAEELCRAVAGRPLSLIQAAALLRYEGLTLEEVLDRLTRGSPIVGDLIEGLSRDGRAVLAALATIEGRSVPVHLIERCTGLSDLPELLEGLVHRGLMSADEVRFRAVASPEAVVLESGRWPARWAVALAEWAESHKEDPETVAEEAELIGHVIEVGSRAGHWPEVLRLCEASDLALALSRRWGAWKRSLERAREAAAKLGKTAVLAWALHQLGTRAVTLGQSREGQRHLAEAERLREPLSAPVRGTRTRRRVEGNRRVNRPRRVARSLATRPLRIVGTGAIAVGSVTLGVIQAVDQSKDQSSVPQEIAAVETFVAQPRILRFEGTPVGLRSEAATVILERAAVTTMAELTRPIGSVAIDGSHPGDFTIEADRCSKRLFKPSARCTVSVSFRPSGPGPRSANLVVTGPGERVSASVALSGLGLGGTGDLIVDPLVVDFGSQRVGATTAPRTITIQPTDQFEMSITSIQVTGPGHGDFAVTETCSGAIPVSAAGCRVDVSFTPSAVGARAANLVVHIASRADAVGVALSGVGYRPPARPTSPSAPPFAPSRPTGRPGGSTPPPTLGPTSPAGPSVPTTGTPSKPGGPVPPTVDVLLLEFGDTVINGSSEARPVTLRNDGATSVDIGGMALVGADADDFSLSGNTCQQLAPGGRCEVRVGFTARGIGSRSAVLTIPTTGGEVSVTLRGTSKPKSSAMAVMPGGDGYVVTDPDGRIFSFGTPTCPLQGANPEVVGVAVIVDGGVPTCWVAAANGAVVGSDGVSDPPAGRRAPVVAITAEQDGYWLVTSAGEVFPKNAPFLGDTRAVRLNSPIVGMAATPSGNGYWFVAADGGVFAFGDATFRGSTGSIRLEHPVVGMARTPSGGGYWLATKDGGVYAFGDAPFSGASPRDIRRQGPIVAIVGNTTPPASGYWMLGADGSVKAFGGARFFGAQP